MDGIINFNKHQGITSHDAVAMLRRLTGIRKIGHTGSLDPMATGVLPLCVGKATRLIEYMEGRPGDIVKAYRCEMRLGLVTDTMDIWGSHVKGAQASEGWPGEQALLEAISRFVGEQVQYPPVFSAVKVGGRKLYEYARAGEEPPTGAIKARTINIKSITLNGFNPDAMSLSFDVECSRGTYIRVLCHEIGQSLGCGAVMSGLIRLRSGAFSIEDSTTGEELEAMKEKLPLFPLDYGLKGYPEIRLDKPFERRFINGMAIEGDSFSMDGAEATAPHNPPSAGEAKGPAAFACPVRVYGGEGVLLGMGKVEDDTLKPLKVIV